MSALLNNISGLDINIDDDNDDEAEEEQDDVNSDYNLVVESWLQPSFFYGCVWLVSVFFGVLFFASMHSDIGCDMTICRIMNCFAKGKACWAENDTYMWSRRKIALIFVGIRSHHI